MAGTAGKKTRVKVATAVDGTYNIIQGIRSAQLSIDGTNIDDSEFGSNWMQRIQGLKDIKITLSGNRRTADDDGQNLLRDALIDDDVDVFIQFLPDNGTTADAGIQVQMKVAKWSEDNAVEGAAALSIELEGAGTPTLV